MKLIIRLFDLLFSTIDFTSQLIAKGSLKLWNGLLRVHHVNSVALINNCMSIKMASYKV